MTDTNDVRPPGTDALTSEHHRRWARGLASFADLARELNVSKQAIHATFQRRRWTRENAPPDPVPVKPQTTGLDDVLLPEADRLRILAGAHRTLVGANLRLIGEIDGLLAREKGSLGVTNIGTLARALQACSDNVIRLLVRDEGEEDELPVLEVRLHTDEEDAAIRAEARRQAHGLDGVLDEEDPDVGLGSAAGTPDAPRRGSGLGSAGTAPTAPPTASSTPPPSSIRPRLAGPLPTPDQYRPWLLDLGVRQGRRSLRQIAEAVGRPMGIGIAVDVLVEAIVEATGGNPERLRDGCDVR